MTTLRQELTEKEFDWDNGYIVWQEIGEDAYSPEWPGDDLLEAIQIDRNHYILDEEFNDGYGAPQMPRFIAEDRYHLYFPCQYDGATWVVKIKKKALLYTDSNEPTPYPGG